MAKSKLYRKKEEQLAVLFMRAACAVIILTMALIIFTVFRKGFHALNWEILTTVPKGGFYFGGEGGILNAIIGSFYLAIGSTLIALCLSLPSALFMNIHLRKYRKITNIIRLVVDVLWGIPSVVYGAFAFSVMIYFGMRASLLAGIITVALFITPIMLRAMDEALQTVPTVLYESTLALGSTKFETAYKVFAKQCIPGIATAILLSFGRAIGDAAAVLFTAGFTDNIPTSLNQPAATLPLSIFFQLSSPIPEVQERAYAAAVALTLMILLISVSGRLISNKYARNDFK